MDVADSGVVVAGLCVVPRVLFLCSRRGDSSFFTISCNRSAAFSTADGLPIFAVTVDKKCFSLYSIQVPGTNIYKRQSRCLFRCVIRIIIHYLFYVDHLIYIYDQINH